MRTRPYANSIQDFIDDRTSVTIFCHNSSCNRRGELDLLKLRDRLGPDYGMLFDQDCRDLGARIQPTREKAEMSLWGTIPEGDPAAGSFYLLLSQSRLEPTYWRRGDYDFGNVVLGSMTSKGETRSS
jgi:hypothetical protein